VRILAAGHVAYHKGSHLLAELVRHDRRHDDVLELHFLGSIDDRLRGCGVAHGPYRRDELPGLVARIRPSFAAVLSVWAETYCHTLSEAWWLGIPVLGSELGAVGERLRRHGGGWPLPIDDVEELYRHVMRLVRDPQAYQVEAGRASIGSVRTAAEMAADYESLYRERLKGREGAE
jgi:glycosyltransferase involved in cell wall biosynthesis